MKQSVVVVAVQGTVEQTVRNIVDNLPPGKKIDALEVYWEGQTQKVLAVIS